MGGVLGTLRAATPSRRSVTTCVDGELQAEWDDLNNALDGAVARDARGEGSGSLAMTETTRILTEMDAIGARVAASEVTFEFQKMDWDKRVAMQAAHPPRDGNHLDRLRGFNTSTFYRAEIAASCVSVTGSGDDGEPETVTEIPADVWTGLLGEPPTDANPDGIPGSLNLGQVQELVAAAEQVNTGRTTVPPSARSLLASQDSGTSLAQPSPGQSPRDGSEDGSPAT